MNFSSGKGPRVAVFREIFVARKRLCQEFVLASGIDGMWLEHSFQDVKRIA
jgi:hypothetical protein